MLSRFLVKPRCFITVDAAVRCQRTFSSSSGSNRKELRPLIKCLHPDLLTQAGKEVRVQNLSCIQNINELWDTLGVNVEAAAGKPVMFGVDVKLAFREQYDLTCYLREAKQSPQTDSPSVESTSSRSDLFVKHTHSIHVPEALRKRQSIAFSVFSSGIESILVQQGQLFELAGIPNPWKDLNAEKQAAANGPDALSDGNEKQQMTPELDLYIFEKWMTKNMLYQDLKLDRNGRSYVSRMLNTPEMQEKLTRKGPGLTDQQRLMLHSENDVDLFVQVSIPLILS
jgi:hypothetical protein